MWSDTCELGAAWSQELPPPRFWDGWPEAQKSRRESSNSAASVVLE